MREKIEGKRGHISKYSHEIKLFTDKDEMIMYVNRLENIENADVFKIEDNLYKVHVVRKNQMNPNEKEHECCGGHQHEHKHDHDHECCGGKHHDENHECCQEKHQHQHQKK